MKVEGDLRYASEMLVWQHSVFWMDLGYKVKCKDTTLLEIRI